MTIMKRRTLQSICKIIWILASLRMFGAAVQLQSATGTGTAAETTATMCPTSCGNVSIPFPFNLGVEGCPGLPQYRLDCKQVPNEEGVASNSSLLTLSSNSSADFEVLNILADSLLVNATNIRATCCNCTTIASLTLDAGRPYVVSGENKFFVNGCNSRGYFSSDKSNGYLLKCETGCKNPDPFTDNYCNEFGCCSSPVPSGSRGKHHQRCTPGFMPCSFALDGCCTCNPATTEIIFSGGGTAHAANSSEDSCGFSSIIYPKSYSTQNADALGGGKYGLKLQWAIQLQGANSCEEVRQSPDYACASAASCKYADSVPGYNCICDKEGYTGDGYQLGTGCSDVNECENPELNSCDHNAICTNTDGGHNCKCKDLFIGDGLSTGSGCAYVGHQFTASLAANSNSTRKATKFCRGTNGECKHSNRREKKFVALVIGIISTSVLMLVLCGKFTQWVYKLWSWHRYRPQNFYSANLTKLKSLSGEPAKLFTYKELSKAASGFIPDLEIGTGGYGTVFKGTLPGDTLVAIKKTNHVSESGAEQFLNEVTILSQVNHRNLVKLLGCCLETEVPMLVYEFIPNGTLYDHLQAQETKPLNWGQRLQIAIETAEALTYLHSAAFPPIYHRDVKSTNILLDMDLTVKVTDFGLSRLVPKDVTHVSTVVMGTPGYMDPEYYHNYQLTDKSDVYSFGVVLMELITSLKPVDFTRNSKHVNLAALSLLSIKSGSLTEIIDPIFTRFPPQARVLEAIHSVATLAVACLAPHREQRPGMKEVMEQLGKIKEDYDCITEEASESIRHKEYSNPVGILGIGGTGAFTWDSLGLGSMDGLLNVDLIDLEGR